MFASQIIAKEVEVEQLKSELDEKKYVHSFENNLNELQSKFGRYK
jgi:hypothetical protein